MSRRRTLGTKKKVALLVSAAAVAGGGAFMAANASNASPATANAQTRSAQDSTVCQGLATAVGNNQRFIDDQRANPDAQSEARIANREAVIAEIGRQQAASGCTAGESAAGGSAQDSQASQPPQAGQGADQGGGQEAGAGAGQAGEQAGGGAPSGQQVCNGSTVTLSGEAGAPAASSNHSRWAPGSRSPTWTTASPRRWR